MSRHHSYAARTRQGIDRSLNDLYRRIAAMVESIPENADLDKDKKSEQAVRTIFAIEEEWILDPKRRRELSVIQFSDEDDDEDDYEDTNKQPV